MRLLRLSFWLLRLLLRSCWLVAFTFDFMLFLAFTFAFILMLAFACTFILLASLTRLWDPCFMSHLSDVGRHFGASLLHAHSSPIPVSPSHHTLTPHTPVTAHLLSSTIHALPTNGRADVDGRTISENQGNYLKTTSIPIVSTISREFQNAKK